MASRFAFIRTHIIVVCSLDLWLQGPGVCIQCLLLACNILA
jgi:hypothetical protein